MSDSAQRHEIDANFNFLQRQLSNVLQSHRGEYALIKSCRFEGFFARPGEAYREGITRFSDGVFSIQQVTDEPLHLGFLSIA